MGVFIFRDLKKLTIGVFMKKKIFSFLQFAKWNKTF